MSSSVLLAGDVVEQKGNSMHDVNAQVKSIDDFSLERLSGLSSWERKALKNRDLSPEKLLKLGRGVAHDLTNGGEDIENPRYKYMQHFAEVLDRAGFIRHDLDTMTLRYLWLYSGAVEDYRCYPWGMHWFNWAYENLDYCLEERTVERNLKCIQRTFIDNDPDSDFQLFQLNRFVRWFGLDDATKLPGSVLYPELLLAADPEQRAQSEHYYQGKLYSPKQFLGTHTLRWLCQHLPTFMGIGGHEEPEKSRIVNALGSTERTLAAYHFMTGDDEIRKQLIRMAGMGFGPSTKPPTTELAIDELWLPADVHDHLKQAGLRKVSDLQRPDFNYLDVKGMRRTEWEIFRTALVLKGFPRDIVNAIPFKTHAPIW